MMEFHRALFIQLRRIGDILMCTPAIRAFKSAHPECSLDFLTEHPEVLDGNPYIEHVIRVDKKVQYHPLRQIELIKRIRAGRYDLVVDFLANPRSAWYTALSGVKTRLSYGYGHRRWAYNLIPQRPQGPTYAAIDKLRLLSPIGIECNDPRLDFCVLDKERTNINAIVKDISGLLITISPVSRKEYKRWPLERFAILGDMLTRDLGASIVILAGPGEEKVADKMASLMSSKPSVPRITRLGELGAIFEKAALHIGNDNGPKHIAVAVGAPTFTIFGRQDPISWTYPDTLRHFWISPDDYCQDCRLKRHRGDSNCIELIPVEAVAERVRRAMEILLRPIPKP